MRTTGQKPDPAAQGAGMTHEADVGSGEPSPGQRETDEMIRSIPPRGNQQDAGQGANRQSDKPSSQG